MTGCHEREIVQRLVRVDYVTLCHALSLNAPKLQLTPHFTIKLIPRIECQVLPRLFHRRFYPLASHAGIRAIYLYPD